MKKTKNKKLLCVLGLTAITLSVGACGENNKNDILSSLSNTSFIFTGTTTATSTDSRLQLKMYGTLYYGGMRSIYAILSEGLNDEIENNKYESKLNTGIFLAYCIYLNNAVSYYDFNYPGTITLNDEGYIQEVSAKLDAFDEELTITITYSSFEEAECDVDFDSIGEENLPGSFQEANKSLYNSIVEWKIENIVPYLYSQEGYADYVGWARKENEEGETTSEVDYAYMETGAFKTETETEMFIEEYKAKLLKEGFVETTEVLEYYFDQEYTFYQKGDYKIAIGKSLNWWNGYASGKAIIAIKSDFLESPELPYDN